MSDPFVGEGDSVKSIATSLDLLSHPHRRAIVRYLVQMQPEAVTHDDLLEYFADRTANSARADVDQVRIATTLRHVHLPKLDDADVVEYDSNAETAHVDHAALMERLEQVRLTVTDLQDSGDDADW